MKWMSQLLTRFDKQMKQQNRNATSHQESIGQNLANIKLIFLLKNIPALEEYIDFDSRTPTFEEYIDFDSRTPALEEYIDFDTRTPTLEEVHVTSIDWREKLREECIDGWFQYREQFRW